MMDNLTTKDKLQFIRLCVANKNIPDINSDFICECYDDEYVIWENFQVTFFKLTGIRIGGDCNCEHYLAEYWPDNLIEGYKQRCQRPR